MLRWWKQLSSPSQKGLSWLLESLCWSLQTRPRRPHRPIQTACRKPEAIRAWQRYSNTSGSGGIRYSNQGRQPATVELRCKPCLKRPQKASRSSQACLTFFGLEYRHDEHFLILSHRVLLNSICTSRSLERHLQPGRCWKPPPGLHKCVGTPCTVHRVLHRTASAEGSRLLRSFSF